MEIVDQKAANRNFRANVKKNRQCSQHYMRVPPDAVLFPATFDRAEVLRCFDARKLVKRDRQSQKHKDKRKNEIWKLDGGGLLLLIGAERLGSHGTRVFDNLRGAAQY